MVHVSIKDPICEVRKMSYKFWEFVIDTLIIKQNGITKPNANIAKLRDTGCIHVSQLFQHFNFVFTIYYIVMTYSITQLIM